MSNLHIGRVYEFKTGYKDTLELGLYVGTYYYAGCYYYLLELIEEKSTTYSSTYNVLALTTTDSIHQEQAKLIRKYYSNSPLEGKKYVSRAERDIILDINKNWALTQLNYTYE